MVAAAFPPALLGQPHPLRLAYFAHKVVAHPRLHQTHQAVLQAIGQPAGASLILVIGPTGVGKTTLRRGIEKHVIDAMLPELGHDPGRIPVVALEAVAGEAGQFNWKDFYTRALRTVDEPLIAHKIREEPYVHRRESADGVPLRQAAVPELRRAWEQALRYRRPAAVIIDEAQHLAKMPSGRRLLDQMDVLKSLAALTETVHVLLGTYELAGLTTLSAQLSRRSREIHFGRYRTDDPADRQAFQSVLFTFQRHLPLAHEPDLVGRFEYLYEQSVGCVGVLKDWLHRALAAALEDGAETLTARHLEQQAEPARKLLSLAREIQEGEAALREDAHAREAVRRCLGLQPPALPSPMERAQPATARRQPARVAERLPVRDPVGAGGSTYASE
jgi:energy-coupling factor transporter ATP-binding protein EcfA2